MALMTKDELYNLYIEQGLSQSQIGELYNTSSKNINAYVRKYNLKGLKPRVKYPINEDKCDITNPIFCYFAGLTATDGHLNECNNRVVISVKNEGSEITLQNILNYFECKAPISNYSNRGNEIRITSEKLLRTLACIGVQGTRKTYDLQFPNHFYNIDCLRMYLRGVLDGDGSIKIKKSKYTNKYVGGQFRLVTASQEFIQGVINCVNKYLNLNCKLSIAKIRGKEYPKLEMTVEDSLKFYDFIYKGFEEFRFKDKYDKYLLLKGEDIV